MRTAWTGLVVLLGLIAGTSEAQKQNLPARPDIILVTIDTLRADHVHCYGYDGIRTPTLDALAKDGIRFTEAFTPSPITNTSHISILTGLLPSTHGVTDFGIPLGETYETWAQLLKEHGYHTAAFIGSVVLDSNKLAPGLNRGFDFYDNFPAHAEGKSRWGRLERRGMEVVARAEAWLDGQTGPQFVWVHLYDPHDPYEPPEPFLDEYKGRLYDGEIAYADSALGNLLNYLRKKGRYEHSVVMVVGDHGEGLGEHHEETHGTFLYDATTHVPLIFKLPEGAHRGETAQIPVETIDILPTVLSMLDAPLPAGLDGRPLQRYFAGEDADERYLLGETDYPLHFGWAPLKSVRAKGFKLIAAPRSELYDLRKDPGETRNLFAERDTKIQGMRDSLVEIRAKQWPGETQQSEKLPDPKDKIEEGNLIHRAMLAQEDMRFDDARHALEMVLQLDADSWPALGQLGQLEMQGEAYSKAAEHLKAAQKLRPQDAMLAFEEGRALEAAGDLAGARAAFDAGLRLSPQQADARIAMGRVCLKLKDFACAADQFDAALLAEPESLQAGLGLAEAEIAQGNFADAVDQLQRMSQSQPTNAQAFDLLARAYRGLHKNNEAEQAERKARSLAIQNAH